MNDKVLGEAMQELHGYNPYSDGNNYRASTSSETIPLKYTPSAVVSSVRERIKKLEDKENYDGITKRLHNLNDAKSKLIGAQRELDRAQSNYDRVVDEKAELEEWLKNNE